MKNKLGFKSMKTRLTCWFFIVALLPLITIIIINGFQRVNAIKKREFNKLTAIRDLKANQVNEWLNEKIGDIKTISTSFILREYLENISINKDRPINNKNDIIKLGKEFSGIESKYKTEENLVKGCQVKTWFYQDGSNYYIDSNSVVVRGFISLLMRVLPDTDFRFIDEIGLGEIVSPLKANSIFKLRVTKMGRRVSQG